MKVQLRHKFEDIISVENLLRAWQEFIKGKRNKPDVQLFAHNLIDNILQLHNELSDKTYTHGGYYQFYISDPKPRNISKAQVKDRLLHHAIYRILYPFFDKTFIADSYSCRVNKGTYRAINRFQSMFYKVSKNNIRTCWILKCDIRKFFASIDQAILIKILKGYVPDQDITWLLEEIILSFPRKRESRSWIHDQVGDDIGQGLPLGNLTSQLFVNVYMNEFDQFVKHKLKAKHYIRYTDDFVILSQEKQELINHLTTIKRFLKDGLKLTLHPDKVILKTFASGIDFLGWIIFPYYRVLRTSTKNRIIKRVRRHPTNETLQSYLGLIKHGNSYKIQKELLNNYWLFRDKLLQ